MIGPTQSDPNQRALIPHTGESPNENIYTSFAKRILAQSFDTQFRDYRAFHRFGEGEILVLLGTSTAGKSSIISALTRIEPSRIEHGIDMACNQDALDYMEYVHPEEYRFLQTVLKPKEKDFHMLDAVFGKILVFKENVTEADQAKARQIAEELAKKIDANASHDSTESKMLDEVLAFSACGQSSVFDILEIESIFKHIINRQFHAPLKIALVYCPFKLLSERMAERNRKALANNELHEVRAGTFPLFQFAKLFGPKQNPDDLVVESVTREDVEKAFDLNFDAELEFLKKQAPEEFAKLNKEDRTQARQKLLVAMGFTDSSIKEVELTPRFKQYDFLIDTSKVKPDASANKLRSG